jgi:hypothetical protein
MVQVLYIHVCKWKKISFETILGMEGVKDERKWWRE